MSEEASTATMAATKELAMSTKVMHIQEKLNQISSRFDEAGQHCTLDILPLILQNSLLPFHHSQGQDISEEAETSPQWGSKTALLSFLDPLKSRICMDSKLNYHNLVDIYVQSGDPYSLEVEPESCEVTLESSKTDGLSNNLQKAVLWRQASFKTCSKIVQSFMDQGLMLLKFTSRDKSANERIIHDITPSNQCSRRYKRVTSIDSRKIVILFSILSSFGTLVLIYLTIRVRQQSSILD